MSSDFKMRAWKSHAENLTKAKLDELLDFGISDRKFRQTRNSIFARCLEYQNHENERIFLARNKTTKNCRKQALKLTDCQTDKQCVSINIIR